MILLIYSEFSARSVFTRQLGYALFFSNVHDYLDHKTSLAVK